MIIKKALTTKRGTWLLCAVALAACTMGRANAACDPIPAFSITIPPVVFDGPADGPALGQALGSDWGGMTSSPNYYSGCQIISIITYPYGMTTKVVPGITYTENGATYPIYATSVPGIGLVVGLKGTTAAGGYVPMAYPLTFVWNGNSYGMGIDAQVKLVAIGQLKTGIYPIASGVLGQISGSDGVGLGGGDLMFNATTLIIKASTCQMSSATTQNVPLPKVGKSQFSGVGSSPNAGYNFSLTTLCNSGVKLYATMTDGVNPANTGNILTPGEGTTASGVGVQILRNDTPISFGPDSSASGNTNQWYIGTAGSGASEPFTIPLRARYIQTASDMVAGVLQARATVTFSYQ